MKCEKLVFRLLAAEEIAPSFLDGFERRQEVMLCYRRSGKGWEVRPDPFLDDWSEEERAAVVRIGKARPVSFAFVSYLPALPWQCFSGREAGSCPVCFVMSQAPSD